MTAGHVHVHQPESVSIESLDDIPDFATEAEERVFWSIHRVSPGVYDEIPRAMDDDEPGIPVMEPPHSSDNVRLRFDLE